MQSAFNMNEQHLQTLTDIKQIMERSSRFISLSGLSGVVAGIIALIGAAIAYNWLNDYYLVYDRNGGATYQSLRDLEIRFILLGITVLVAALASGMYFTWRKAKWDGMPVWTKSSKNLLLSMCIPLAAGGAFIAGLIFHGLNALIAPTCLVFYGMALLNTSKYTYSDIRYLAIIDIVLGICNLFMLKKGLYFWAVGFGVMHIIYGTSMWWKYERKANAN